MLRRQPWHPLVELMKQVELLTVEHRFGISKPGVQILVLAPDFRASEDWSEHGWGQRQVQVTVIRPDGSSLPATAVSQPTENTPAGRMMRRTRKYGRVFC